MRKKILDRFVSSGTVRIEMPENIAFKLMAQAMKTTDDPVLQPEWNKYRNELNENLVSVRGILIDTAKKHSTMGQKTVISDEELRAICPMHPYAALLLKHMSVAFNSNARSMFDFIISNDVTEAKGFKWFINEYGPLDDEQNLLTIDMLWDFFTGKNQNGLNDDVRVILDSYGLLKKGTLKPEEERVFKTVLLLEAISMRVNDVELLRPNEQNIDLAFEGTDWLKGKARNIAIGLCQKGLLFERPVGRSMKEYTVANRDSDAGKISKLKDEILSQIKTQNLILDADLLSAVLLPAAIQQRFVMKGATSSDFTLTSKTLNGQNIPHRFKVVVTFALNDTEAEKIRNEILKAVVQNGNELFYIQCLTPMGEDLLSQYVENMAYSKNYMLNDRQRAKGFEEQAKKCLNEWRQKISAGAFMLYTPENKSGFRHANLAALQEELQRVNRQKYYCGLEQFNLIDNMFQKGPLAQGAECGIAQELKGSFKSANVNTSLETALKGAWQTERYWWEDQAKQSLPIVRIKKRVEELIQAGFETSSGRISMLSIYEALEEAPFGFMPANVTAFVMGFVLKEYANDNYFWSNGSSSESMSLEKMKQMIANAIKQKDNPSSKYKEEYIVAMGEKQRAFLRCTSEVFNIPKAQCGSIESARDQMRVKMKNLAFPIWCLNYILDQIPLESSPDLMAAVINDYCGIANTANSIIKAVESELAERIGSLVNDNEAIVRDLKTLLTDEMCRKGMLAYIDTYEDGALRKLADEIGDGGAYLNEVKRKFNADAANWVWSQDTAKVKISDVILEYRIIAESNKSLPKCTSFHEIMNEWNRRTDNIRIPYDSLKRSVGSPSLFLEQLYTVKSSGGLQEQNKQKFYDALVAQREAFDQFYKDQLPYFKEAAGMFLERMDEQDIAEFFRKIPVGQFTMSREQFDQKINMAVNEYKMSLKKNQLKELWMKKTGTKDPAEWSVQYKTPILCLFDDMERGAVKFIFEALIHSSAVSEADITKAIEYLKTATFYDRLNNSSERDRCFLERVVCDYNVMLQDVEAVRKDLCENILDEPYSWMDNSAVQNRLKKQAEKAYRLGGCERAKAVINRMNPDELRQYLNDLIADNLKVGMEILKKG